MTITIKLFGTFRFNRFVSEQRSYKPGSTINQIFSDLNITEREIGIAVVNDNVAGIETELNDGDFIGLYPLLGGG